MAFTSKQIYDLNNAMVANQNVSLGTVLSGLSTITTGSYTAVSGDASASAIVLAPGLASVTGYMIMVSRSGSTVTADAKITVSGSKVTIADGASTYNVTTGDVVNYILW